MSRREGAPRGGSTPGPRRRVALAFESLQELGWRDLARIVNDSRAHPGDRARAEALLTEKIETLTSGERTSLARTASRPLIPILRRGAEPRALAALLRNPRLVEADVIAIAADPLTRAGSLSEVVRCSLWNDHRAVNVALALNPSTPAADALRSLARLDPQTLERIARDPSASPLVRTGASRLLGAPCELP